MDAAGLWTDKLFRPVVHGAQTVLAMIGYKIWIIACSFVQVFELKWTFHFKIFIKSEVWMLLVSSFETNLIKTFFEFLWGTSGTFRNPKIFETCKNKQSKWPGNMTSLTCFTWPHFSPPVMLFISRDHFSNPIFLVLNQIFCIYPLVHP